MASLGYFNYFPKIIYTFDKNTLNQQVVTNILARSTFLKEVSENSSIYFKYQVQESDTPEIIAHKIYGSEYRSWIILLFNKYINPMYEFPLKEYVLEEYITNKYSQTITEAKAAIHHYEQETTKTVTYNGIKFYENAESRRISEYEFNFTTNAIVATTLPATADTSLTVNTETKTLDNGQTITIVTRNKAISNYQHEVNENEARRTIQLIDPAYVTRIEQEFKQLMRE